MQVMSFFDPSHPAGEVDVSVAYPVDFDALVSQSVPRELSGREIPVASLEHLIEMKRSAGRPRDLDEVDALRRLLEGEAGA